MPGLADDVLPLIRTRAELWRWRDANAHGDQMHEAIDILEDAIPSTDPAEVYTVTHKALASAITVISKADDSSGIIGDACRRLLALHPVVTHAAKVPPRTLVDWMMKFQFDGKVDYFELDPVAYAPALGEAGLRLYRDHLDTMRANLGVPALDNRTGWPPYHHETFVLDWNDRRLAVLDHDVKAIIRTHARDRRVAAWFEDTARALDEVGETELAIDWARQGTDFGDGHQSRHAAEYWCELLARRHPEGLLDARLGIFRRWPDSSSAARLVAASGEQWPGYRDEVLAVLAASPRDSVVFAQLTLKDLPLAWELAHSLGLSDFRTWSDLVKAYETIDPAATLPVHRELVEVELEVADARNYRFAARRIARMRKLAAGTPAAGEVDAFVAELRDTHRRRPRLQAEFDRAGLP